MATDTPVETAVLLRCEHWGGTVSHTSGDRRVTCATCGVETTLRAKSVTTVRYVIVVPRSPEDGGGFEEYSTADVQAEMEVRDNIRVLTEAAKARQPELWKTSSANAPGSGEAEDVMRELDCPVYQQPDRPPWEYFDDPTTDSLPDQLETD